MRLAPLDLDELGELVELQNQLNPESPWTRETAEAELLDRAREGGALVRVAREDAAVVGFCGWVKLGAAAGEFYGAPLYAATDDAAQALIDRIADEARRAGAAWVKVSATDREEIKRGALVRNGFAPCEAFLTLARALPAAAPAPMPAGLRPIDLESVDFEELAALHNACFRDVANAPPIGAEVARDLFDDGIMIRRACELWADDHGYQAFSAVRRDGMVDSVAVAESWRGRGVGATLMLRGMAALAEAGHAQVRTLVARSNQLSLAMHDRLGFTESSRRNIYRLDL